MEKLLKERSQEKTVLKIADQKVIGSQIVVEKE